MIKKILTIIGFIALVVILVGGGIIRTRAITGVTGLTERASEKDLDINTVTEDLSSELMTLEGVVQDQDDGSIGILVDTGESILLDGRSYRFLGENSFQMIVGDRVSLIGFYENGTFKVTRITNLVSGETLTLRDKDGHPAWAGGEN